MTDNDGPRTWPVWSSGARIMAEFKKGSTIHCYTHNMKALGLVVPEKKIFVL